MAAGTKKSAAAKADGRGLTDSPLQPRDAKYESLSPHSIAANPENPRMNFHDDTIEQLAESIKLEGMLVPLTVYKDRHGATTHVLLDGERRWRAAKLINLPEVPAWVIPKPNATENAVRMFNIHMLREEWDEIAVAWAIEKLMKQTGIEGIEDLHKLTGLSRDRLRNLKIVLGYTKGEQKLVADGKLSYNYLIELQKNVLTKLAKLDEDLLGKREREVRTAFIRKYLDSVDTDPIALRQVGRLIETARTKGNVGTRAKHALRQLVDEPQMTVEDAYEIGAAASVELRRVLRDMQQLPERLQVVKESKLDASQSREFRAALGSLHRAIADLIGE